MDARIAAANTKAEGRSALMTRSKAKQKRHTDRRDLDVGALSRLPNIKRSVDLKRPSFSFTFDQVKRKYSISNMTLIQITILLELLLIVVFWMI